MFITTKEAAEYLGLAESTLEQYRSTRKGGPVFYKKGKVTKYDINDLDRWIFEGKIDPSEGV